MNRDASIQRFEVTFELTWKTLKNVLEVEGITENTPRQVLRAAGSAGLIENVAEWLECVEIRNLTSHSYDEALADRVYSTIPKFSEAANLLLERVRTRLKK
jgi:nucleotidyltransferase substrate binding protein (TIGR01987 family)